MEAFFSPLRFLISFNSACIKNTNRDTRGQRQMSFFRSHPLCSLRQGLSKARNPLRTLGWVANKSQRSACPTSPAWGLHCALPHLGSGDWSRVLTLARQAQWLGCIPGLSGRLLRQMSKFEIDPSRQCKNLFTCCSELLSSENERKIRVTLVTVF